MKYRTFLEVFCRLQTKYKQLPTPTLYAYVPLPQCRYKSHLSPQSLHVGATEIQNSTMAHANWTDHVRIRNTFSSNNHFKNHLISFPCSNSQPSTQTGAINRDPCTAALKALALNERPKPIRLAYITKYLALYHDLLQLTLLSSVIIHVTSLTYIDLVWSLSRSSR